jgi:hypothetical protein
MPACADILNSRQMYRALLGHPELAQKYLSNLYFLHLNITIFISHYSQLYLLIRVFTDAKIFMFVPFEDLHQSDLVAKRHDSSKFQSASVCKPSASNYTSIGLNLTSRWS